MAKPNFHLIDDPSGEKLGLYVRQEAGGLMVYAEGYGQGQPVMGFVLHDGKLRAIAFGDVNSEEPTATVELEGAREE